MCMLIFIKAMFVCSFLQEQYVYVHFYGNILCFCLGDGKKFAGSSKIQCWYKIQYSPARGYSYCQVVSIDACF